MSVLQLWLQNHKRTLTQDAIDEALMEYIAHVEKQRDELMTDLTAARNALLREGMQRDELLAAQNWQPIETAPQDGTVFLGYIDGRVRESYRVPRDDCEMWVFGGSSGSVDIAPHLKPTHWMPLPNPPQANTVIASVKGTPK